jgi:hypothetical protein
MFLTKNNYTFIGSLVIGVFVWLLLFLLLPVENKEPLQGKTIGYILVNYAFLILGFYVGRFKTLKANDHIKSTGYFLKILLLLLVSSYLLRWYDLFFVRGLSFDFLPKVNRAYNDQYYFQSTILLIIASILKSLYFFPYVIVKIANEKQHKIVVIASYLLLFFPVVEALLKGNRKPFLEIFFVLIVTSILTAKKIKKSHIVKFILGFVALMMIAMTILFKRERLNTEQQKKLLLEARYNDLLAPKKEVVKYINSDDGSPIIKEVLLTSLHLGQYYTHGVFEFNNFIHKKDLLTTYGKYTFNTFPKLINKTSLFKPIKEVNPSPREYVYVTTFGGFYLDFRWFSIVIMFLFGIFQKYVFEKSKVDIIWSPIMIYIIIINLFLMVINYIRGAGIYPFVSILLLLAIIKSFRKRVA